MAPLRRLLPAERSRWSKNFRTTGYFGVMFTGLTILLHPEIFPFYYMLMGVWCLAGGLLSGIGSATGRWAGEYMGLPLLTSAMGTFALLTVRDAGWTVGAASVLLLGSIGCFMLGRWFDVRAVGKAAKAHANGSR